MVTQTAAKNRIPAMGLRKRSAASSLSTRRSLAARGRARTRRFRPRIEPLESRCLLATGIYSEDFSSDLDPTQPGFDTDLDGFQISHQFSAPPRFFDPSAFPPGPDGDFFSPPHALFLNGTDQITFPDLLADEFVNLARVNVVVGTPGDYVRFISRDGRALTVVPPFHSGVQAVIATSQTLADDGQPLGHIAGMEIRGSELRMDDVSVLVTRNFAPEPQDDEAVAAPRETIDIDVLANDGSSTFDPLTIVAVSAPQHGQAAIVGSLIRYVSNAGFAGQDSFTYSVADSFGTTATALVVVNVVAPTAADDAEFTLPGVSVEIDILGNDFSTAPLTIDSASDPDGGSVAIGSRSITYAPDAGFHGEDTFTYTVRDDFGNTSSATVRVTVNNLPIAADHVFSVPHDHRGPLAFAAPGLLAGAVDPDGDAILAILETRQVAFGTVAIGADGSFTFEPSTFDGAIIPTTFAYRVRDAFGSSDVGEVHLEVPNTPPVAYDASTSYAHGTPAPVSFAIHYDDADGDAATPELIDGPAIGAVTLREGGIDPANGRRFIIVEYNTASGVLQTTARFTYRLVDRLSASNVAQVEIGVANSAPIGAVDRYEIQSRFENSARLPLEPYYDSPQTLLANDLDLDGDPLEAAIVSPPLYGSLDYLLPDGSFRYRPPTTPILAFPYVRGRDSFTYRVSDGVSTSEPVEVIIDIQHNSPGFPEPDTYYVRAGQRLVVPAPGVQANDVLDADPGDPSVAVLQRPPSHGSLTLLATGALEYVPEVGFTGVDYFVYKLTDLFVPMGVADGPTGSAPEWVHIVVGEANDTDADGISDLEEDAHGSGNSDDVPDSLQPNVASFDTAYGRMTLAVNAHHIQTYYPALSSVTHLPAPPAGLPPASFDFPFGFFSFNVTTPQFGDSLEVAIYLPDAAPAGASYQKFGPEPDDPHDADVEAIPHWYEPDEVRFDSFSWNGEPRHAVYFRLTDGGRGDGDVPEIAANGVIVDPGGVAVARPAAPQVQQTIVNGGSAQRSMVTGLTVEFDRAVSIQRGAFDLRQIGARKAIDLRVTMSEVAGRTVALLTFHGSGVQHGSLKDGTYRLTIRADKLKDADGNLLDGDGDGLAGGNSVDEFFRRFGDTDGDNDVDLLDLEIFQSTYGKRKRDAGYLWYLDFNANGRVWKEDLALLLLGYVRSAARR